MFEFWKIICKISPLQIFSSVSFLNYSEFLVLVSQFMLHGCLRRTIATEGVFPPGDLSAVGVPAGLSPDETQLNRPNNRITVLFTRVVNTLVLPYS